MRSSVFTRIPLPVNIPFAVLLAVLLVSLVPAAAFAQAGVPDPGQSVIDYPPEQVLCGSPFVIHVTVRDNTGLPVPFATVDMVIIVQSGVLDPGQPGLISALADPVGEAFVVFPQGILGEAVVHLETFANGIPLDPSPPYIVTQPCVTIAGSSPSEVCLGQQLVYNIEIQNCSNGPADIDVSATVNGLPAVFGGPSFFPGVPPGALVQTTLLVDCNAPGNMTIQATADLQLSDNPACFAQDNLAVQVTCVDPCLGVAMPPNAVVCLGDLLELPVTVTNCGNTVLDVTLDCTIGGAPLPPMVIPSLPPGVSTEILLPVVCNGPGLNQVECLATGTVPGNPGCETVFLGLAQIDCVEACVTASIDDVSACPGASVDVPLTATNCGSTPADIVIDWTLAGVSQPSIFFAGVGPGQAVVALLPVVCGPAGTLPVDCSVTALPQPGLCAANVQASATVTCLGDAPAITSVVDVPNDQGRRVRIQWDGSCSDWSVPQTSITGYSIWRRIDAIPALSLGGRTGATRPASLPPGDWDYVDTVPAIGLQSYSAIAGTLCDSTIAAGPCLSTFVVVAMTPNPQETYVSAEASGYSLDNLAPSAPGGLMLVSGNTLNWNESEAADFNYFTIYGSSNGALDGSEVVLGHTVTPTFNVAGSPYVYYHVTATDFSGNEGSSSQVLSSVAVPEPGVTPGAFALYQSRPNPFRSSTLISFDLPKDEHVRLQVFDVTGRLVKTILNQTMAANRYTVPWSGTDESGTRVAPGIYLYRLESPSVNAVRKAILVQ